MKNQLIFLTFILSFCSFGQDSIPKTETKKVLLRKKVEGMCIPTKFVLELYNGNPDEAEPKCSVNKEELIEMLNNDLTFLKNHPDFKGRGMVSVIINCMGKVVGWAEVVKSRNDELNKEILQYLVMQNFDWEAGIYKEEAIDSIFSFSYQIVRGKLRLN
ncbi:hypothetical protein [Fluviicola taffensis]|uniref:hypothetical protein n=1 Tax=Fluviicola taffensis TaxID=191579 RepID=UPI00313803B5